MLKNWSFWTVVLEKTLESPWTARRSNQSSDQISRSVVSDSLQPHGLQHTRLSCPSPTPAYSNSCPLSRWCHPTISSSGVPFSSCSQYFSASGSFPWMNLLLISGGQSIEASASAAVLPMNIQGWFPLGLTVWTLCCSMDFQESSPAPQSKNINSSAVSLPYGPTLTSTHDYWENHSFGYMDLCWQSDVSAF